MVNNLPGGLKTIVNLILVVKALLSYPLPYYATCEILEKELFRGKPDTQFPTIWSVDGELKVWGLGKVICPKYYKNSMNLALSLVLCRFGRQGCTEHKQDKGGFFLERADGFIISPNRRT